MSKNKYCPLKFQWGGLKKKEAPCLGSMCAWWDENEDACAVTMLAYYLGVIWSMGLPPERRDK